VWPPGRRGACGDAPLSQQEKNSKEVKRKKKLINIISFLGAEARCPSEPCSFEELAYLYGSS
jgi:hypothetical protein